MKNTLTSFYKNEDFLRKPLRFSWVYFFACFLLFGSQVIAQQTEPVPTAEASAPANYKFMVGATSGGAVNRFTGQPQAGLNLGYTGGLFVNYAIHENISLQLETNYLQQGGSLITFKDDTRYGLEESFTSKNVKNSSYKIHSLEIPLLAQYSCDIKQTWKPVVYIGGSAAFNMRVTEKYQKTGDLSPGDDIIATVRGHQAVEGSFEKTRFNFITGAGLQLPLLSKLNLLLDFRYVLGLTPARKGYSYMEKVGFGSDVRSSSFISRIGVAFPIM